MLPVIELDVTFAVHWFHLGASIAWRTGGQLLSVTYSFHGTTFTSVSVSICLSIASTNKHLGCNLMQWLLVKIPGSGWLGNSLCLPHACQQY